jgi:putative membrane protein
MKVVVRLLVTLVVSALAVWVTARLVPGVVVDGLSGVLWTALAMGIINTCVRPIIKIFALPITILTLGIFSVVINAFMVLLVDYFVDGFHVNGFWWALLFSVVLSVVNFILLPLYPKKQVA